MAKIDFTQHLKQLDEAHKFVETKIKQKFSAMPTIGLVLGSGLGDFANCLTDKIEIPYATIPAFHQTTVEGHAGQLVIGKWKETLVLIMQGRFHPYEGLNLDEVVLPIRLQHRLGVKTLILTNAAGGINLDYKSAGLVLIKDHINLTGRNALVGPNLDQFGPRFPDMSDTYCERLRNLSKEVAKSHGIDLKEGVYAGVLGPTYETPAEVRMLKVLGADMVGMSTVQEAIVGHHAGMEVLGISCITNMASGISVEKLRHEDIKDEALKAREKFTRLLQNIIEKI
jgi:purine-nucleoside phosphorylase